MIWRDCLPSKRRLAIDALEKLSATNRQTYLERQIIALLPATQETDENIIAALDAHFSPRELAPKPGTTFHKRDIALFGLSERPQKDSLESMDNSFCASIPKPSSKRISKSRKDSLPTPLNKPTPYLQTKRTHNISVWAHLNTMNGRFLFYFGTPTNVSDSQMNILYRPSQLRYKVNTTISQALAGFIIMDSKQKSQKKPGNISH